MQDGIIAGNGNSRYLKTVSAALSLYHDYESFMAALIAGTFPIDLNGINTGGWVQQGTPLNKASLLADATAELFGLSEANTPNDALAKIKALIDGANANANGRLQGKLVSYVGTGTFGESTPTSITFPFVPICVMWIGSTYISMGSDAAWEETVYKYGENRKIVPTSILTTNYKPLGFVSSSIKKSADGKTLYWYNSNANKQCNINNYTYYFLGVG